MVCINCGKKFELRRNPQQKCCSRACNAIIHNQQLGHKFIAPLCKRCGKPTRRESRAIYCSASCQFLDSRGAGNSMWKGGRKKGSGGYILVHNPKHPFADVAGYVLEHRLMVEKSIGRYLSKAEVVHHINRKKDDNRLDNLILFSSSADHLREHNFNLDSRRKSK